MRRFRSIAAMALVMLLSVACRQASNAELLTGATVVALCRRDGDQIVVVDVAIDQSERGLRPGMTIAPMSPLLPREPRSFMLLYVVRPSGDGEEISETPFNEHGELTFFGGGSYREILQEIRSRK